MIIVQLPYPPSTNRMWRNNRGRMVLSDEGKTTRQKPDGLPRLPEQRLSNTTWRCP